MIPKDKVGVALSPFEQQLWTSVYAARFEKLIRRRRSPRLDDTSVLYAEESVEAADLAILAFRETVHLRDRVHMCNDLEEEREMNADPIGFQDRHGG